MIIDEVSCFLYCKKQKNKQKEIPSGQHAGLATMISASVSLFHLIWGIPYTPFCRVDLKCNGPCRILMIITIVWSFKMIATVYVSVLYKPSGKLMKTRFLFFICLAPTAAGTRSHSLSLHSHYHSLRHFTHSLSLYSHTPTIVLTSLTLTVIPFAQSHTII